MEENDSKLNEQSFEDNDGKLNEQSVDVVLNCPGCGSALVYSPEAGTLKCPTCGYVQEKPEVVETAGQENDLEALIKNLVLDEKNETLTVHCPTCGAESTFEENVVAGFCQFCKNPIVASSRSERTLRPQGIVPFAVTRDQAASKFKSWAKSLWFAPNSIKHANLHETMKGVYSPIWTFDFRAITIYTGKRGEHYYVTETRMRNGKREDVRVQKTRWYPAYGAIHNDFDDVTVFASSKVSQSLQAKLKPWSIKDPVKYADDVVRGFIEENYDMPLQKGLENAKSQVQSEIRASVKRDIGGDEQRIDTMETRYHHLTYKLLLVPFWCSRYRHGGKDFQFLVNGENGKADGERPYSAWKIFFFILVLLGIAAGVIALCMNS